jgi:hypothetical protein
MEIKPARKWRARHTQGIREEAKKGSEFGLSEAR